MKQSGVKDYEQCFTVLFHLKIKFKRFSSIAFILQQKKGLQIKTASVHLLSLLDTICMISHYFISFLFILFIFNFLLQKNSYFVGTYSSLPRFVLQLTCNLKIFLVVFILFSFLFQTIDLEMQIRIHPAAANLFSSEFHSLWAKHL